MSRQLPGKGFNKVKPGGDQAFTLPKGTSAAPIMNRPNRMPVKKGFITEEKIGTAFGLSTVYVLSQSGKPKKIKKVKKNINTYKNPRTRIKTN